MRREDLPEEVYRSAWQRLDLKSAVLGRAKVLYGPIRELAVQRVPGIGGEVPVNFLQLNRNLDAYQKRIRMAPETEPAEFSRRRRCKRPCRCPGSWRSSF